MSWTERCAGLDVHQKTVLACLLTPEGQETRTFGTMTADWLALSDWLQACGCTHVAMESTGDDWKPVFNMLAGAFEVLLVNAQPGKAVPGRKTDVKDAAWLTELLCQIDRLDETIARFDERIQAISAPFAAAVAWLDTIPGIAH
jgi:hypothetical protein